MRPQTFTKEVSLDIRVPSFPGVYGAMAFETKKGLVDEGTLVTSDTELLKYCTPDEDVYIGYSGGYYSALAFLLKSNKLYVSRAAADPLYGGALMFQDMPFESYVVNPNLVASSFALKHLTTAEAATAVIEYTYIDLGDRVVFSISEAGTMPAGLTAGVEYFAIPFDSDALSFQVAETIYDALNGEYITISDAGSGDVTVTFAVPDDNAGILAGWTDPSEYMLETTDGRPSGFNSVLTPTLLNSEFKVTSNFYDTCATGDAIKLTATTFPAIDDGDDDLDAVTDYYVIKTEDDKIQIARSLVLAGSGEFIPTSSLGDTITVTLQDKAITGAFTNTDNVLSIPADVYNTLFDNDIVEVSSATTLPAGLTEETEYYVTKTETNKVTLSLVLGGSVVALSDTGTGIHTITLQDKAITCSVTGDMSNDLFGVSTQFFALCAENDKVQVTSDGTMPTGIAEGVDYYIIKTDEKIALATSLTAVRLGNAIDITDGGSGTHTIHLLSNENLYGFDQPCVLFTGSNPGAWNNNIFISTLHYPYGDSNDWTTAQDEAADTVKYPGCFMLYVYRKNAAGDYSLVETHLCSREEGFSDGNGVNCYVEDKLLSSNYLRAYNNAGVPSAILPKDQTSLLMLTAGDDGGVVTDTEMLNAFEDFRSTREKQVTLLMDSGWATPAYQKQGLISIAESRKDCFALLSCPLASELSTDPYTEVVKYRKETLNANTSYAALYTPHLKIRDTFNARDVIVAPDGYIGANISEQSAVSEFWLPPAGERRGQLNVLDAVVHWSEGKMDDLYNVSVNPIDFHPGKGIFVMGQKTLLTIPCALDRINCRLVLIVVEPALKSFLDTFIMEYNDITTRAVVWAGINSAMKKYKARGAFYDYTVVCDTTNNPSEVIDANEMNVYVYVQLTKSCEFISLTTIITPTGSTITLNG